MENFEELQLFVNKMKNTSSMIEKKKILKEIENSNFIKNVLHYTYNPYKKYHITSKNCKKQNKLKRQLDTSYTLFSLLDALNERKISGHDAIHAVNTFIEKHNYDTLIYSIIDKNIEIRASECIINSVFQNLIPTFDVALAQKYEQKLCDFDTESWLASRKLDGVRCIVRKEGNSITAYSRQGNELTTVQNVVDDVSKLDGDFVLDGEICLMDCDGKEDFQAIMKEIKRKNHTITNPKYIIFDCLHLHEFDSKKSQRNLLDRINFLDNIDISQFKTLEVLKQENVKSTEQLSQLINFANENKYEGIMLRKNTVYEGKRTKNLLKCKTFYDDEYKVIDVDFEEHRIIRDGKEVTSRMLAQVWIEHKGHKVAVGSGWNQEQRIFYEKYPEKILGQTITVQYFEETINQSGGISLRFPTVKHVYNESRDV